MRTAGTTATVDLSVDIFSGDFYYVLILSRIHFNLQLPQDGSVSERVTLESPGKISAILFAFFPQVPASSASSRKPVLTAIIYTSREIV